MKEEKYGKYYNASYYLDGCGPDYNDKEYWTGQFQKIAENIVSAFSPKTFLDVGCAYGYLVAALRDLGVEAYGVDVSEYAISQAREDIRAFCYVCNAAEGLPKELPQTFDCISTIEVIEHLYEEDAQPFIKALCQHTDQIIFSSTPDDFKEPSHFNVQQQEYWVKRFAKEGFLHALNTDVTFLSPQALVFRRQEKDSLRLIEDYEHAARVQKRKLTEHYDEVIRVKDKYIDDLHAIRENETAAADAQKKAHLAELQQQKENYEQQKAQYEQQKAQYEQLLAQEKERYEELSKKEREAVSSALREVVAESYAKIADYQKKIRDLEQLVWSTAGERDSLCQTLSSVRLHEHQLQYVHDQIVNSTFWKMTWPARRVVSGAKKLLKGGSRGAEPAPAVGTPALPAAVPTVGCDHVIRAGDYWKRLNRNVQPIDSSLCESEGARLNLVTDSLAANSLFGGVATSLLLATEFVKRHNMPLRIITRDAVTDPKDYYTILELNDIEPPEKVEFFCDADRDANGKRNTKLPVSPDDIFFATSWWSAKAVEKTTLRKRFFYIIQEVETFFYPYGDEHLFCKEVMENQNIDFIVNSSYLWDYFKVNEPNIVKNGVYFEPAFSTSLYQKPTFVEMPKRTLFFYSRPNNPRNLFAHGLLFLDEAIKRGIIDTEKWEICFAGQDVPEVAFCDGSRPTCLGQMSWEKYRSFVKNVDLALSLMYTPHPSYPPYDVAVSGGVVITNKFQNKDSFPSCNNIVLGDLNLDDFMDAMEKAVALAQDMDQRKKNYESMTIQRSWKDTFQDTILKMGELL